MSSSNDRAKWSDYLKLLSNKNYNLNAWAFTVYHFALGAYAFWGPSYLSRNLGVEESKAPILFGAALVITGLIGTLLGGSLADRWNKNGAHGFASVCTLSIFLTTISCAISFMTNHVPTSIIFTVLTMLFAFIPTSPMNSLIFQTSPQHLQASAMALCMFMIHMFGDMWSPQIVGQLSDRGGGLKYGLSLLPFCFLAATVLWGLLALNQRKKKNERV